MPYVLIIAYGNPLRSDDGVAWRAADALEGKFSSAEVEIVRLHQLGPELAESLSRSECVIFVDAATGPHPGEIEIKELAGTPQSAKTPAFGHALSPESIITLAVQLYHACPRALSATITGQIFEHGESLSPAVAAALPEFVARIEGKARELLSDRYSPDPLQAKEKP
jgi:hydrogenase maturation protease